MDISCRQFRNKKAVVHKSTFLSVAPWPFCWVLFISGISWMSEWEHLMHSESKNPCGMGLVSSGSGSMQGLWGFYTRAIPGQGSPSWCCSLQRMCGICLLMLSFLFCALIFCQGNGMVCTVQSLDDSFHVFLWISGEPGPCYKRSDDKKLWFCYSLFVWKPHTFSHSVFIFFIFFFSSDLSLWRWIPKLVLAADYYTRTKALYIFPSNFRFLLPFFTAPSIKMLFQIILCRVSKLYLLSEND